MRGLTGELSPPQGVMETGCRRAPTALELSQRARVEASVALVRQEPGLVLEEAYRVKRCLIEAC